MGLLPQTTDCFGTRGRTQRDIKELVEQSLKLQDEGASMLVLEKVATETAALISQSVEIPTIGMHECIECTKLFVANQKHIISDSFENVFY